MRKVFLDENLPEPLAEALPRHKVDSAASMGWSGIKNGEPLKLVSANGFDVFLTGDKNLQFQNVINGKPFSLTILNTTNWRIIEQNIALVNAGINNCKPGRSNVVDCNPLVGNRKFSSEALTSEFFQQGSGTRDLGPLLFGGKT